MKKVLVIMMVIILFAGLTFADETVTYEKINAQRVKKITSNVETETYNLVDLQEERKNLLNKGDRLEQAKAILLAEYDKLIAENIQRLKDIDIIIAQIQ